MGKRNYAKDCKNYSNFKGARGPQKAKAKVEGHIPTKEEGRTSRKFDGNMDRITDNDISWWNKSPLYDLSTNVQYNRFAGYAYDNGATVTPNAAGVTVTPEAGAVSSQGAVLKVKYYQTLGVAKDASAPINQCFNSLFATLVQNTNSGNVGFQQADLSLWTLGTLSVVTLIAEAKRILGLTNMYFRENSYYPGAVLSALGMNNLYQLQANRPAYVSRLQTLIMNFNAMGVPAYIDIFKRGVQLGRNVYQDEDQLNSLPFFFEVQNYYVYVDTAGVLESRALTSDNIYANRLEILLDAIETSLEAFRNTSDLGLVLGAIRRAFPEAALIKLDLPTYADVTEPQYERNVCWQFNNLHCIGQLDPETLTISQNPVGNFLYCSPEYVYPELGSNNNSYDAYAMRTTRKGLILNSFTKEIGNEFVMESTRMIPIVSVTTEDLNEEVSIATLHVESCGTEIPQSLQLTWTVIDGDSTSYASQEFLQTFVDGMNDDHELVTASFLSAVTKLSKFDTAPRIRFVKQTEDEVWVDYGEVGNYSIYTEISLLQLTQIHLAALQSAYALTLGATPSNSKISNRP